MISDSLNSLFAKYGSSAMQKDLSQELSQDNLRGTSRIFNIFGNIGKIKNFFLNLASAFLNNFESNDNVTVFFENSLMNESSLLENYETFKFGEFFILADMSGYRKSNDFQDIYDLANIYKAMYSISTMPDIVASVPGLESVFDYFGITADDSSTFVDGFIDAAISMYTDKGVAAMRESVEFGEMTEEEVFESAKKEAIKKVYEASALPMVLPCISSNDNTYMFQQNIVKSLKLNYSSVIEELKPQIEQTLGDFTTCLTSELPVTSSMPFVEGAEAIEILDGMSATDTPDLVVSNTEPSINCLEMTGSTFTTIEDLTSLQCIVNDQIASNRRDVAILRQDISVQNPSGNPNISTN